MNLNIIYLFGDKNNMTEPLFTEISRHQVENEWYFCACIVSGTPIVDYAWLDPDIFVVDELKRFWTEVLLTGDPLKAANKDLNFFIELTGWANRVPSLARADEYARAITEINYYRHILAGSLEITKKIKARDLPGLQQLLSDLNNQHPVTQGKVYLASDIHSEFSQFINAPIIPTLMTNTAIDPFLGGLARGEVLVLASRPSVGKSAIALQIARNVAEQPGKKSLIFTLEMTRLQLWARIACGVAGISWTELRSGKLNKTEIARVDAESDKLQKIYGAQLLIQDEIYTVADMYQIALQYLPDLIVIDHLGEIEWSDPTMREVEWFGLATKYIKRRMAKGLNSSVILIHQLNRLVEGRPDKRPVLSDLRQSGEIEQLADVVLMLYREDYYSNQPGLTRVPLEILVRKNRQGASGTICNVTFDLVAQWFYDANAPIP